MPESLAAEKAKQEPRITAPQPMQVFPFPEKFRDLEAYRGRFAAHRMEGKEADVYFAGYPAGKHIPEHHHNSENHGFITSGAMYLTMNGKERKYSVGDWYHVPYNAPHAARFEEDTAIIEFWFKES